MVFLLFVQVFRLSNFVTEHLWSVQRMRWFQYWDRLVHCYILGPYYVIVDVIFSLFSRRQLKECDLSGQVAVVTGGHRGIGAMVSSWLLAADVNLILGCRKIEDGEKFVKNLRDNGVDKGRVTILHLDLASLQSVRKFAEEVANESEKINFLVNNAGIWEKNNYVETEDKFECQWQVNYLSHFLLSHLLLPALQKSDKGKIVNVSSLAHRIVNGIDYEQRGQLDYVTNYGRSKLAQIMSTLYLDKNLKSAGSSVEVVSVHPGIVNTDILKGSRLDFLLNILSLVLKNPKKGAKPIIYAALYGEGGQYYVNCHPQTPSSAARDPQKQKELFDYSMGVLNISSFSNLF